MRVLVVDDDPWIRDLIGEVLTDEGYDVVTAPNGAVALDLARQKPPDLILLDMSMPIMDGWTFARHYRQMSEPQAPIVVLTAAPDAAARAAQVAADDFLAKPFDLNALLDLLARYASSVPQSFPGLAAPLESPAAAR